MSAQRLIPLLLAAGLAAMCQDQPQDDANCKDSQIISRMAGSHINSCDHKEFDQIPVKTGQDKDSNVIEKKLEGEIWTWDYGTRDGVSEIQVFRNIQTALQRGGFTVVYTESPGYLLARKGDMYYQLENSGSYYYQYLIHIQAMQQEVTADASTLKNEIESSGRVSVYGINFETGKAAITPESEPVLAQVQKLLDENGDLKLRIEGHTDNVGARAANQALSAQRAAAVRGWLVAHGISEDRLTTQGFADAKPLADNSTEEGRAKNRRVDLVKL